LWLPWVATSGARAQGQGSPVVIGESVNLPSNVLKESRALLISKPAGYDGGTDRYPVLYLLDGETHFHYTSGIVNFLGENDRIPKMLVVGIVSGSVARRTRDLTTPSKAEMDNRFSPGNGGADAFLSFIADELIPYVDRCYRTRPYKVLIGHSLGGLFCIRTLVTKPKLFNGFIAIDPSIYWNNQEVVAQAESFFPHTKDLQADVYLTAADASGKVPAEVRRLTTALAASASAGLRWNFELMKQENHASIPLPGIYRGLETLFADWRVEDLLALFDQGGIEAIHKRFRDGGRRFGFDRTTPAFTVSMVVAQLIWAGRLEEAAKALLHDTRAYPPPWNQLDAIAKAYESRGDAVEATRYYLLSLKENPRNELARDKLTKMGVKIPDLTQR
jgi:predicted alpha/beta superfamily hydrolase